jgi:hypothetical protein
MDVYLNDHLGGATLGANLAGQIADHAEATPLADVMTPLHAEIDEDRRTLLDLMDRMDATRNPVKQATGWLAEPRHVQGLAQLWNVEPGVIPHWAPPTHAMQLWRYAEQGSIELLWISATNPTVRSPSSRGSGGSSSATS